MASVTDRRLLIRTQPLGVVWLVLVAGLAAWFLVLMDRSTYDTWGAVLVAPVLILVSLPALRHQAAREDDPRVFTILVWALLLKLGASLARYYVAFGVYGGVADAARYLQEGASFAGRFHRLDFTIAGNITGTGFPGLLTGVVYSFTWPTKVGAFLVFSWIAFWGLFLFYRAFVIAVPEGRRRTYARLVFFLPSLLFWPSSVGKDAWMLFGLGLAAYGIARLLTTGVRHAVVPLLAGVAALALVRPHIAAMVAIAAVAGYVVRPSPPEHRELGLVAKVAVLAALAVGALFLVRMTNDYLERTGVSDEGGISDTLQNTMFRTQQGGSSFQPSVLESPTQAPLAAITVLFRPLIPEAENVQGLLAAIEGTALLLWSLWRWRWIVRAAASIRRQPYMAVAIAYVAVFIFAFSSIANFGILARQRSQVLPFFLVLLAIPTPEWWERHPDAREVEHAGAESLA
jgi:hypothetical protein